jgi:hypothetical protein
MLYSAICFHYIYTIFPSVPKCYLFRQACVAELTETKVMSVQSTGNQIMEDEMSMACTYEREF